MHNITEMNFRDAIFDRQFKQCKQLWCCRLGVGFIDLNMSMPLIELRCIAFPMYETASTG